MISFHLIPGARSPKIPLTADAVFSVPWQILLTNRLLRALAHRLMPVARLPSP